MFAFDGSETYEEFVTWRERKTTVALTHEIVSSPVSREDTMRSVILFATLGVATALSVACGDFASDSLVTGSGPTAGFTTDGGNLPPNMEAGATGDDGGGTPGTDGGGKPGTDGGGKPPPQGAGIPCDVQAVLNAKCVSCHSSPPINGSLSALVTLADLMATAKEDTTKNEAQLSLIRMQNTASPMPPASIHNPATAAEIAAFKNWINGNYVGSCGGTTTDGGTPPPPPPNVFTGAPGFVSSIAADTHNAGQNCMGGCHDHGFTFAGTLTDGVGNGVAGAEVRLVDANGTAISVHTGTNGNFHSSTPFVAPAHVGARNATKTALMIGSLTLANGGCNGCHKTGGTAPMIHLP